MDLAPDTADIQVEELSHQFQQSLADAQAQPELSQENAVHSPAEAKPLQDSPSTKRSRVGFENFSAQIRTREYHEQKRRSLERHQQLLRTAVALSARLYRVAGLIQNGLVETCRNADKNGFLQAYHAIKDLREVCYKSWESQVQPYDPVAHDDPFFLAENALRVSFTNKISPTSRNEILDFINLVRINASFLVARFKALSQEQLSALSTMPKYQTAQESMLLSPSGSRHQASAPKRNLAFVNALKERANSFERSSPISTLLFNMYGISQEPDSKERRLRLDVWSSICGELFLDSDERYPVLIDEVLTRFASLHQWRAKRRIELLLMDLLQRGAFLLQRLETPYGAEDVESGLRDPLRTPEAEKFFEDAIREIFVILDDQDGGLPFGALDFGSAVIGKMSSVDDQSRFRGYLFFRWFFCEFLRVAVIYPEVSIMSETSYCMSKSRQNEGMLLHYHVTSNAREHILYQIWFRTQARVSDVFSPV